MAAAVGEHADLAGSVAEEDDRIVADPAGERLAADFIGPGGDVPGIAQQHRMGSSAPNTAGDDKARLAPGKAPWVRRSAKSSSASFRDAAIFAAQRCDESCCDDRVGFLRSGQRPKSEYPRDDPSSAEDQIYRGCPDVLRQARIVGRQHPGPSGP